MPIRKEPVTENGIYHILNRGVDKRIIFIDDSDHYRFISNLYEFNDANFDKFLRYRPHKHPSATNPASSRLREELVEILSFSLMPNHYHLLIKSTSGPGFLKFMKRLNQGYSRYFNDKYKRSGTLFENRYKSVSVINEAHFTHIPYYIHLNPLDLVDYGWREGNLGDLDKAISFLNSYRWSSHLDYTGIKNFPSVTKRDLLLSRFNDAEGYRKSIRDWLSERTNFSWMKEIILE